MDWSVVVVAVAAAAVTLHDETPSTLPTSFLAVDSD
jgi:hypothetical protein